MPKVELYIKGSLCDIRGDESIDADYAVFDINNIESRGGIRSYEFEIPKTNRNKTTLDNPEVINNLSLVPYQRSAALLYVDGVDMLIRFCEIQSVKDYYRIRLYGSNSGFYELIRNKYLEDLSNICDYQHHMVYDNVINSRHNTAGYIYPIIDYHTDSPNAWISDTMRQIDVSKMLPSLFYEELVQKIIEDAGYTYVNNAPAEEVMLLPCSTKPKRKAKADLYEAVFEASVDRSLQLSPTQALFDQFWCLCFDNAVGGCANYWDPLFALGLPDFNLGRIPFGNKISFTVDWNITLRNDTVTDFPGLSIIMSTDQNNSSNPALRSPTNFYEEFFDLPAGQSVTLTGSVTLITDSAPSFIFNNDYFSPYIGGLWKQYNYLFVTQMAGSMVRVRDVQVLNEVPNVFYAEEPSGQGDLNTYITVGGTFDYTQIEILKQYCLILGLMIIVDEVNKRVILEKFDKVTANISLAYDWSNKIDLSEEPEITFIGGSYGQNSNFRWKSDDPEAKPAGTDGVILIQNENLEKNVDVVQLEFASCNSKNLLNELDIPNIPVFEGGVATNELTQRVLYHKKKTSTELDPAGDLIYYRTGTTITPLTVTDDIPVAWFINATEENNLGFANNILESRYSALATIIPRYKNISVLVRLNASDINQLDFLRPVYIQKYESYFYISAIKGFSYTSSESTIVELVKLNING